MELCERRLQLLPIRENDRTEKIVSCEQTRQPINQAIMHAEWRERRNLIGNPVHRSKLSI